MISNLKAKFHDTLILQSLKTPLYVTCIFHLLQDKIYKNVKQPCEVNPDCLAKRGAEQAICIRKCISESCYDEIYAPDEVYKF